MDISATREVIADAINAAVDVNIRPRQYKTTTWQPRDGWIAVERVDATPIVWAHVTFNVWVVLGSDPFRAEELFDEMVQPMIQAIDQSQLGAFEIGIEPQIAPQSGDLQTLVLTFTMKV